LAERPPQSTPPVDEITHEICIDGAHRTYRICEEFRADLRTKTTLQPDREILRLVETLNAFVPAGRIGGEA
jgi:hypothetical protein